MKAKAKTLRLVLGDQLSFDLASLKHVNPADDVIIMAELQEEVTYVKHHKRKIVFIFSAMRHFAKSLSDKGIQVDYKKFDDPKNTGNFTDEVRYAVQRYNANKIVITAPGEYRLLKTFNEWEKDFGIAVTILEDDRFMCTEADFSNWADVQANLRMDTFYRYMRKKNQILLCNGKPIGGKWSLDAENRSKPNFTLTLPAHKAFAPNQITLDVIELVEKNCPDHFGSLANFDLAVTRQEALDVLRAFLKERLNDFGTFQDAMIENEPWMYHSLISLYLNTGLLNPKEVILAAEKEFYQGSAPLNSVEGFIRQILGWREFIRGLYWLKMPKYVEQNFFNANRKLPQFYWTGDTEMNCIANAVDQTKNFAYAHHIQRLMVLGNFALLAGLSPKEVNEWFLIVYSDAYEWVELPNVSGMALYADGGALATKPYASSGAYINRMSNYCKNCRYLVTKKNGPEACPFNYLYWDFLKRNQTLLEDNIRLRMPYKTLQKMSKEKKELIDRDAQSFLRNLT